MPNRGVFRGLLAFLCAAVFQGTLGATSYPAVNFTDLVTRADVIFVGEVVDVRPFPLQTRDRLVIKTRVIFRVIDPLFGTTSVMEVFDFLGGEWQGEGLAVAEMPKFVVGERQVMFARRSPGINPIVGFTQGRLRVVRDGVGTERVFTNEGAVLARTQDIGVAAAGSSRAALPAMRLSDLRTTIVRALNELNRR